MDIFRQKQEAAAAEGSIVWDIVVFAFHQVSFV
jgi:hypothetical protein